MANIGSANVNFNFMTPWNSGSCCKEKVLLPEYCPLCQETGNETKLLRYQLNLTEATVMCPVTTCPYPMGSCLSPKQIIQTSNFMDPTVLKRKPTFAKEKTRQVANTKEKPIRALNFNIQEKPALNDNMLSNTTQINPLLPNVESIDMGVDKVTNLPLKSYMNGNTLTKSMIVSSDVAKNVKSQIKSIASIYTPDSKVKTSSPLSAYEVKKNNSLYLQWQNRDALCWLDVSMLLLLHCSAFCKLLQLHYNSLKNGKREAQHLLYSLYNTYCNARDSVRQAQDFRRCAQSAREGRYTTLQMSIGRIVVRTGGGRSSHSENNKNVLLSLSENELTYNNLKTSPSRNLNTACTSPVKSSGILKQSSILRSSPRKATPVNKVKEWILTSEELEDRAENLVLKAKKNLEDVRTKLWLSLQPAMKCELGINDSPVFALPLLLKENPTFEEFFTLKYYWQMDCTQCGYHHIDSQNRPLPSFPEVPKDFCMLVPYFIRPCFQCQAPSQRLTLIYQHLPDAIIGHFVDGLHEPCMSSYDFIYRSSLYAVKGVVQYINNPDHFVAWIRDNKTNQWMECDGLKDGICSFSEKQPNFSTSQVHIVLWENVGSPSANIPVNVSAQRLMSGCPNISPLPLHLTKNTTFHVEPLLLSSSDHDNTPRRKTDVTQNHHSQLETKVAVPALSIGKMDGQNQVYLQATSALDSVSGITPITNLSQLPIAHREHFSGSKRTAKQLNEINEFICNSMQAEENVNKESNLIVNNASASLNSREYPKNVKLAQKVDNERLQRIKERLQKTGSSVPINTDVNSGLSLVKEDQLPNRFEKKTNNVRHLSVPSVPVYSQTQASSYKKQVFSSLIGSPSQKISSIQELIAKVKGTVRRGNQTFDAYKPKRSFQTVKADNNVNAKKSHMISPIKKSKITFGANDVKTLNTVVKLEAKGLKLKEKHQSNGSSVDASANAKRRKIQLPANSQDIQLQNLNCKPEIKENMQSEKFNLPASNKCCSDSTVPVNDQTVPMPGNNIPASSKTKTQTDAIDATAHQESNGNQCTSLDDVMNELCAALDPLQDSPRKSLFQGGSELEELKSSPVKLFLEGNLSASSNHSLDFDPSCFDMFNDV